MADSADLKPYQLHYLIGVAEQGSVRQAAQSLGISVAAVSKGLRELEDTVGLALMVREARGVTLTEAGRLLLAHARMITAEMDAAVRELGGLRARRITLLRVGITPWLAQTLLPQTITRFSARHPDIRLILHETLGRTYAALRDGELDMAIGLAPPPEVSTEFQVRPLFSYSQAVICRLGHPLANCRSLEELKTAGWTVSHPIEQFDPPFRGFFEAHYGAPHDSRALPPPLHITRSTIVGLHVVENSDLLSVVPWPFLEAMRTRYKITAIPLREITPERQTSFIVRRNTPCNGAISQFLEAFIDTVREARDTQEEMWLRLSRSIDLIHPEIRAAGIPLAGAD